MLLVIQVENCYPIYFPKHWRSRFVFWGKWSCIGDMGVKLHNRVFIEKWTAAQLVKCSCLVCNPVGSLTFSQEFTTGTYPKPAKFCHYLWSIL